MDILRSVVESNREELSQLLFEETGQQATQDANISHACLVVAANNGDDFVLELLLSAKIDPNALPTNTQHPEIRGMLGDVAFAIDERCTALIVAARRNFVKICELLIQNGADLDGTDAHQWTSLIRASWNGCADVVSLLAKSGARVDERDRSAWTALMRGVYNGHVQVVKALLKGQPDLNLVDRQQQSALHLAASLGHEEIVKLLLDNGANPLVKDSHQCDSFTVAMSFGHKSCANLIKEKMESLGHAPDTLNRPTLHASIRQRRKESKPLESVKPWESVKPSNGFVDVLNGALTSVLTGTREDPHIVAQRSKRVDSFADLLSQVFGIQVPEISWPKEAQDATYLLHQVADISPQDLGLLDQQEAEIWSIPDITNQVEQRLAYVLSLAALSANTASQRSDRRLLETKLKSLADNVDEKCKTSQQNLDRVSFLTNKLDQDLENVGEIISEASQRLKSRLQGQVDDELLSLQNPLRDITQSLKQHRQELTQQAMGLESQIKAHQLLSSYIKEFMVPKVQQQLQEMDSHLDAVASRHQSFGEDTRNQLNSLLLQSDNVFNGIMNDVQRVEREAEAARSVGLTERASRLTNHEVKQLKMELEQCQALKSWYAECLTLLPHLETKNDNQSVASGLQSSTDQDSDDDFSKVDMEEIEKVEQETEDVVMQVQERQDSLITDE